MHHQPYSDRRRKVLARLGDGVAVIPTAPERLRNYRKLLRETERDTQTALQRKAQLALWKQRSRQVRAVLRAKRG